MKVYISGQISGLPYKEVRQKFEDVQALLEDIGFEAVNPLDNGLPRNATWKQHMAKDLQLLLECDAIYMMDNYVDSKGANVELAVAKALNLDILGESNTFSVNPDVLRIQNAIFMATGMRFNQYIVKSRKRDGFYARMIFVHHCRLLKMKLTEIAKYVHRDHSSLLHILTKYNDDYKYNPQFRDIAERVNKLLKRNEP